MDGRERRQHYQVTFAVLALGALCYTLLQSMVLPALPAIQRELDTTQTAVAWVLTGYLLSASVATPILGRLGDMFGKQRLLIAVFGCLAVGSVLAGLANSIEVLIVARVIQGAGGAVFPLAFGIIRDELPPKRVPGAIGVLSATLGIGSGLGVVVAGPIADNLSFHWLFWIPLILAIGVTVAAAFFVPSSPVRTPGRVNMPAAVLLAGWLVALLLGVSQGPEWGWTAVGTLGLFAGAVVLFALWLRVETVAAVPLIDIRMMRIPAVWWTNINALLLGVGMYSMFIVVPPFLQTPEAAGYGFGASVTASGFYLLPSTATMLLAGLVIGRITHRVGSKVPLVAGAVIAASPFALLAVAHSEPWQFVLTTSVMGLGIGLAFSAMSNLVMESVPATQTGVATGMNANIRTIGGSIGSVVIASILASTVTPTGLPGAVSALPDERGYTLSFAVMAGAMLLAAAAAALIPKARRGAEMSVEEEAASVGPEEPRMSRV